MTENYLGDAIPCMKLWRAVIIRAFIDAGMRFTRRTADLAVKERDRDSARAFLTTGSEDFRLICALAGLEPEYIQGKARKLAKQNWPVIENLRGRRGGAAVHEMAA